MTHIFKGNNSIHLDAHQLVDPLPFFKMIGFLIIVIGVMVKGHLNLHRYIRVFSSIFKYSVCF